MHLEIFTWILRVLSKANLLKGKTLAVDAHHAGGQHGAAQHVPMTAAGFAPEGRMPHVHVQEKDIPGLCWKGKAWHLGSGDVDLCGFFSVDDETRPGYSGIAAEVIIDSPASDDDIERLKEAVESHCPVLDIIGNATPVAVTVRKKDVAPAAMQR